MRAFIRYRLVIDEVSCKCLFIRLGHIDRIG